MSDISKIKVAGVTYDVKDNLARKGSYTSIELLWDGNTENLESISPVEGATFYRVSDALEMSNDQYLIGNSSSLGLQMLMGNIGISSDSSSNFEQISLISIIPLILGLNFGNGSFVSSSLNLQENSAFGQLVIEIFGSAATPELEEELRQLSSSGIQIGVNMFSNMIMYINAPHSCIFTHLANFLFGIESFEVPAGLWLIKVVTSEENESDFIFIDSVYLASPEVSKVVDHGIKTMFTLLQQGLPISTT